MSPVRSAAAARTRARLVTEAGKLLSQLENVSSFSLEAVARAAGVSRLTVYNQFGSRRGLLEEVFDERARKGGLGRIADAMAMADARAGLDRLIEIFCDFWSADPAVGRLHDAAAVDAEFADAVAARNERRRQAIEILVGRLAPQAAGQPQMRREVVDLLFALTSRAMFELLRRGRTKAVVCRMVKQTCAVTLARIDSAS